MLSQGADGVPSNILATWDGVHGSISLIYHRILEVTGLDLDQGGYRKVITEWGGFELADPNTGNFLNTIFILSPLLKVLS